MIDWFGSSSKITRLCHFSEFCVSGNVFRVLASFCFVEITDSVSEMVQDSQTVQGKRRSYNRRLIGNPMWPVQWHQYWPCWRSFLLSYLWNGSNSNFLKWLALYIHLLEAFLKCHNSLVIEFVNLDMSYSWQGFNWHSTSCGPRVIWALSAVSSLILFCMFDDGRHGERCQQCVWTTSSRRTTTLWSDWYWAHGIHYSDWSVSHTHIHIHTRPWTH